MDALITLAIYLVPFLLLGVLTTRWLRRRNVDLSDVKAQGDTHRGRSVFFLGIWRRDDRD